MQGSFQTLKDNVYRWLKALTLTFGQCDIFIFPLNMNAVLRIIIMTEEVGKSESHVFLCKCFAIGCSIFRLEVVIKESGLKWAGGHIGRLAACLPHLMM